MKHHHEGLTGVASILPALALLVPFAGALWVRIKTLPGNVGSKPKGDL